MKFLCKSIVIVLISTIALLYSNHVVAADNERWTRLYENFRYEIYVDIPSIRYYGDANRVKVWKRTVDKGDNNSIYNTRYEIDIDEKRCRTIDNFDYKRMNAPQNSDWWDITPDSLDEKMANIVCEKLNLKPIFNVWVHKWEKVWLDNEGTTYSICKDCYRRNENKVTVYYKIRYSNGEEKTSSVEFNIITEKVCNSLIHQELPITPDTYEEAMYNSMIKMIGDKT